MVDCMHVWVRRILVRQTPHLYLNFAFDDNSADSRHSPILRAQLSIYTLFTSHHILS